MNFASVRVITDNLEPMVGFYEELLQVAAVRPAPVFAQFTTDGAALAIALRATVAMLPAETVDTASNRSVLIEFMVDDVDAEHVRLGPSHDWVLAPSTMPWGNRSAILRDPDGNLVNLFSRPATS